MKRYQKLYRRTFLKAATTGFGLTTALALSHQTSIKKAKAANLPLVESIPQITRTWLGRSFWANRLQDWRLHQGWIECLAGEAGHEVRTVSLLTRELIPGTTSAQISVVAKLSANAGGGGFCGFLIGAGRELDYRAAALVHGASGTGGGLLCTYETDGRVRFREHTSEANPLEFAVQAAQTTATNPAININEQVLLRLEILPQTDGRFQLQLTAFEPNTNRIYARATRSNVADSEICGGIALVSSPYSGKAGARYAFRNVSTGGSKIALRPQNALGPILGALYSLNGKVLKVTAQFMPLGSTQSQVARFQYRTPNGAWQNGPQATIQPGYTALFRLTNWDSTRDWEYRIVYQNQSSIAYYRGTIAQDPVNKPLIIGLFSCTISSARPLDQGITQRELPNAELVGRFTPQNIYFPYAQLVQNASRHNPDLLLFVGDQIYEGRPTRVVASSSPVLDYLYKWYLWILSFRNLTRNKPTIVLVDDHDVYQGNIWGESGKPAPNGNINRGGYRGTSSFVNLVQRTQCGHNPDAYDPTPVLQNIGVYYGAFRYGGVSFAILEDRKFKTIPTTQPQVLLGRQEQFLQAWSQDRDGVRAKVCITQTIFGCVQTDVDGTPEVNYDSNGFPKAGRDRAIALLRNAGALVVSGDQHLASLVRHGINDFTDGVVQFSGPAGGATWQRWFQPVGVLRNGGSTPYTGDFIDGFGNKMRVLAVANPKVTERYYVNNRPGRNRDLGDRKLKSEGYGIIRVNANEYVIECWPWNVNPTSADAQQFPGWSSRLPFTNV